MMNIITEAIFVGMLCSGIFFSGVLFGSIQDRYKPIVIMVAAVLAAFLGAML
jgi:hypothetical protein